MVFLSVGEPSGDLHGAGLARALRARLPGVRLLGLGGPRMAAEGVELLADFDRLAVMGFAEVASRLPFFLRLRKRVFAALREERVDLVVPVDYPGFNLRLARHAKGQGIPVLYYIAPQVWAWHASRARDLARDADRVAVILPFEADFLRENGAAAEFVGHPLLDLPKPVEDRADWCRRHDLDPNRPLLALFPGSRRHEVRRHLEVFCRTAELLGQEIPTFQVCIGAAVGMGDDVYAGVAPRITHESAELLRNATAALVKSGTTTLEAALAGTPFVVAYRMNPLSFMLAKRLVKVPSIALANLVAGRRVVPEFVQEEADPAAMRTALRPLLDLDSRERRSMVEGLVSVQERLHGGAADRVAAIAEELITRRG